MTVMAIRRRRHKLVCRLRDVQHPYNLKSNFSRSLSRKLPCCNTCSHGIFGFVGGGRGGTTGVSETCIASASTCIATRLYRGRARRHHPRNSGWWLVATVVTPTAKRSACSKHNADRIQFLEILRERTGYHLTNQRLRFVGGRRYNYGQCRRMCSFYNPTRRPPW